jgi:hypothetical protein
VIGKQRAVALEESKVPAPSLQRVKAHTLTA